MRACVQANQSGTYAPVQVVLALQGKENEADDVNDDCCKVEAVD